MPLLLLKLYGLNDFNRIQTHDHLDCKERLNHWPVWLVDTVDSWPVDTVDSSDIVTVLSKELLEIQTLIECRFILKVDVKL